MKNGKFHLEHSVNTEVEDVEVNYLWSKDLLSYHSSGEASDDGTVVVISQAQTADNSMEVSTNVTVGEADSIYLVMEVQNTSIVSWGSENGIGGALFSNASRISLVDSDLNLLSTQARRL